MKIPDFKNKESKDNSGKVIPPESNQDTLLGVLTIAVSDKYSEKKQTQQGEVRESTLSGSQGRMWGRIQRKIENAIDEKLDEITFETGEVDFIKTALDGAKLPITWFKWSILIEEALNEVEKLPAKA